MSGMATMKRTADVVLRQDTILNAALALETLKGEVTVVAQATLLDTESSALKAAVTDSVIKALPVGQDYRDLVADVAAVNLQAQQLWEAYQGPRTFRAEQTAFVRGTLDNCWIDLAQFSLGRNGA